MARNNKTQKRMRKEGRILKDQLQTSNGSVVEEEMTRNPTRSAPDQGNEAMTAAAAETAPAESPISRPGDTWGATETTAGSKEKKKKRKAPPSADDFTGTEEGERKKAKRMRASALPEDVFVKKRPLLHPPIPSPYSGPGLQKAIYVSPSSSFMGTVKRVQKLLLLAEKRFNAKVKAKAKAKPTTKQKAADGEGCLEEVVLKGTGRAIERVASIAVFLQDHHQEEYVVRLKAGSVSVVDDLEMRQVEGGKKQENSPRDDTNDAAQTMESMKKGHADVPDTDGEEEEAFDPVLETRLKERPPDAPGQQREDAPESRVRKLTMLEAGVTLKSILKFEQNRGKRDTGYPIVS